jgi:lantibiotic modifying enzyme
MNKTQKEKRNFRASKVWKAFRKQKMNEQKSIDPITKKKLRKFWNLHHRHVTADTDEYQDISNPEHYVCLNSATHDALHWLYRYWKDDPEIIDRIVKELETWY